MNKELNEFGGTMLREVIQKDRINNIRKKHLALEQ